jgi:C1A family cysteine protease
MGALVLFGVPPEKYWPYQTDQREFNKEPTPFCYAFAQNYQGIQYYRLDTPGVTPQELLGRIKTGLAAGLPSMFGFSVYPSYKQSFTRDGQIPYPTKGEKAENGHAVMAVGYDDMKKIKNTNPGAKETRGALLIRNSWGPIWGEDGYGWLPYEYILHELAMDWWAVLKNEWINTNQFGL